jgi:DNA helicase HerA-like ATPase
VVIEEVQRYATPHRMDYWLEQLFLVGRHRGISLLCTTQRPGYCHKTIISQSGHVYFGQLHEQNDLDYCRSVLFDEAFRLIDLPKRKFLYFSPGMPIKILLNSQV